MDKCMEPFSLSLDVSAAGAEEFNAGLTFAANRRPSTASVFAETRCWRCYKRGTPTAWQSLLFSFGMSIDNHRTFIATTPLSLAAFTSTLHRGLWDLNYDADGPEIEGTVPLLLPAHVRLPPPRWQCSRNPSRSHLSRFSGKQRAALW
ncbi:hypothetical protein Q4I28_005648 [Leishmania naiffi]|uniref:Uncharacterized protein n=1 Tax=Leishmania naiffi TaxID=5678 RepID=A0AAW3BJ20_9TRYP